MPFARRLRSLMGTKSRRRARKLREQRRLISPETLEQRRLLAVTPLLVEPQQVQFLGEALVSESLHLRASATGGFLEYSVDGAPFSRDLDPQQAGEQPFVIGMNSELYIDLGFGADTVHVQESLIAALADTDSRLAMSSGLLATGDNADRLIGPGGAWSITGRDTLSLSDASVPQLATAVLDGTGTSLTVTASDQLDVTGDVTYAGNLALQAGNSITFADNVVLNSRQTAGGDPLVSNSTESSGNFEFAAPRIMVGQGVQILSHVEPGSPFAAGNVSFTAQDTAGFSLLDLIGFTVKNTDASIQLNDILIKAGDVTVSADTDSSESFGDESALNGLPEISLDILASVPLPAGVALSQSTADVRIGSGARIEAANVDISASAQAESVVRTAFTGLAAAYGRTEPTATLTVEGGATIVATGDVRLGTTADSDLTVKAYTVNLGPSRGANVDATLAVSESTLTSRTEIAPGATLTVGGDLLVRALMEKRHVTTALAGAYEDGSLGAGVALSFSNSTTQALVDGNVSVAGHVIVEANSQTPLNDTLSSAAVGSGLVSGAVLKLPNAALDRLSAYRSGKSQKPDQRSGGSTTNFALSASFTDAVHSNVAEARIGGAAQVSSASGDVGVFAGVVDVPETAATATIDSSKDQPKESSLSAAVLLGSFTNRADAYIGPAAIVSAAEELTVDANVILPYNGRWELLGNVPEIQFDPQSAIDGTANEIELTAHGYETGEGVTYFNGGGESVSGLAPGVTYYVIYVDPNTIRLAESPEAAASGDAIDLKDFATEGESHRLEEPTDWQQDVLGFFSNLNSNLGFRDAFFTSWAQSKAEGEKTQVAGSVNIQNFQNASNAYIDGNAQVTAPAVDVSAAVDIQTVNLAGVFGIGQLGTPLKALAAKLGLTEAGQSTTATGVGVSYLEVNYLDSAVAEIRDGAQVTTDSLDVTALANEQNLSIAEAGAAAGKYGGDGSFSVLSIGSGTLAQIQDGAVIRNGSGVDGRITVDADNTSQLLNLAGGVTKKSNVGVGAATAINEIRRDTQAVVGGRDASFPAGSNIDGEADTISFDAPHHFQTGDAVRYEQDNDSAVPGLSLDVTYYAIVVDPRTLQLAASLDDALAESPVLVPLEPAEGDRGHRLIELADVGGSLETPYDVQLEATNNGRIDAWTVAAAVTLPQSGGGSGGSGSTQQTAPKGGGNYGIGVSGDVSINSIADDTVAAVRGLSVNAGSVHLNATNDSHIGAYGGAVAIAKSGGKSLGLAGSVAINTLSNRTEAFARDAAITLGGDFSAAADANGRITTVSISGSGSSQAGIAGSVSVNNILNDTSAHLVDSTLAAASAELTAFDTSGLFALAGAAGFGGKGGIGSSVIVNTVDNTASAYASNSDIHVTQDLVLSADSREDIDTIAAAVGASQGGMAAAVSVIVNSLTIETSAYLSGSARADGHVNIAAQDNTDVLAVAGNLGVATGKAALGVSVSVLTTNNLVQAYVAAGANLTALGQGAPLEVSRGERDGQGNLILEPLHGLSVSALSQERIVNVAAGGQGAGGFGIAGSVTENTLVETTIARIEPLARINSGQQGASQQGAATDQDVQVIAHDDTRSTVVAGGAAFGSTGGAGGGIDVGVLTKNTLAFVGPGALVEAADTVRVKANSTEDLLSVGAAIGVGQSGGIAGGANVYSLNNNTQAFVSDGSTIHAGGNVIVAAHNATEYDSVAGSGGFGGSFGFGASGGLSVLNKNVQAFLGNDAVVTADALRAGELVRHGDFLIHYDGSTAPDDVSAPAADRGPLVAKTGLPQLVNPGLSAQRTATARVELIRGMAVTATNQDDIETVAVAGSVALGTAAVVLSRSDHVHTSVVEAFVGERAQVNADRPAADSAQSVRVAAGNDYHHLGLAGAASGASGGGIGPAYDSAVIRNTTRAFVGEEARVFASGDVEVQASAAENLISFSTGLGVGGTAALAGGVSVISLDNVTLAYVDQRAVVDTDGNVLISARDDTQIDLTAGAVAAGFSGGGIGGSVGVSTLAKDTRAFVNDEAQVTARGATTNTLHAPTGERAAGGQFPVAEVHGLVVTAMSSEDIVALVAAGAGGFSGGLAGAVSVGNVNSNTLAYVGPNARINEESNGAGAEQDVVISAVNQARLSTVDGNLVLTLGADIGGTVDVGGLRNTTLAFVDLGAVVQAARDVDVHALSNKDIATILASGGAGAFSLKGTVGVYTLGGPFSPASAERLNQDGDVLGYVQQQVAAGQSTDSGVGGQNGSLAAMLAALGNETIDQINQEALLARLSLQINSDISNPDSAEGTAAFLDGAEIRAGRDVTVNASELVDFNATAGGVTLTPIGVGAGVIVANFDNRITAEATGATITAGGNVSLSAHQSKTADATAIAGTIGGLGLEAAVVVQNDESQVVSRLGDGSIVLDANSVEVTAEDARDFNASPLSGSFAGGIGSGVAGVSVNRATLAGTTKAVIGSNVAIGQHEATVNSVKVHAGTDHRVATRAGAAAAGIGIGAVAVNEAAGMVETEVEASIGAGTEIDVAGNLEVIADSQGDLDSVSTGFAGSSTLAVGVSLARAELKPTLTSRVADDVRLDAGGGIQISANFNTDDSLGATSVAKASSGALVGVSGAEAKADVAPQVTVEVGHNTQLDSDRLTLEARAGQAAQTDAGGLNLAGLGVGAGRGLTTIAGSITAEISDQATINTRGDQRILANSNAIASADVDAVAGGVLSGSFNNAAVTIAPTIRAATGNALLTSSEGDVMVRADSSANGAATTRGVVIAGLSVGVSTAEARITPLVDAAIADGAELRAPRGVVELAAVHNVSGEGLPLPGEAVAHATASGGGVLSGTGSNASAESSSRTTATVGDALLIGDAIRVLAQGSDVAAAEAPGKSAAGFGVGISNADVVIASDSLVDVQIGAELDAATTLQIASQGSSRGNAFAEAAVGGIGSVTAANAHSQVRPAARTLLAVTDGGGTTNGATVSGADVFITSDLTGQSRATAAGLASGGFSVGSSTALAEGEYVSTVTIGALADVDADQQLIVRSQLNETATGQRTTEAARATSTGSAGSIIAGINAGTNATADSSANAATTIHEQATLDAGGVVIVDSRAYQHGRADAVGNARGLVSLDTGDGGSSTRSAVTLNTTADTTVGSEVRIGADPTRPLDDLHVSSHASSDVDADASGSSGQDIVGAFQNLISNGIGGFFNGDNIPSVLAAGGTLTTVDVRNDARTFIGQSAQLFALDDLLVTSTTGVDIDAHSVMSAGSAFGADALTVTDVKVRADAIVDIAMQASLAATHVTLQALENIDVTALANGEVVADFIQGVVTAITRINIGTAADPSEALVRLGDDVRVTGRETLQMLALNQMTGDRLHSNPITNAFGGLTSTATSLADGTVKVGSRIVSGTGSRLSSGDITMVSESRYALHRNPQAKAGTIASTIVETVKTVSETIKRTVCKWFPWPLSLLCEVVTETVSRVITSFVEVFDFSNVKATRSGAGVAAQDEIQLNGDVFNFGAESRRLIINPDGSIDAASNVPAQVVGDDILVGDVASEGTANIQFLVPRGTLGGDATLHLSKVIDNVQVINRSDKNLVFNELNLIANSETGESGPLNGDVDYQFDTGQPFPINSEIVASGVTILNEGTSDILFRQPVRNVTATFDIENRGGDILADSPEFFFEVGAAGSLTLNASGGSIGSAAEPLKTRLVRGKLGPDGSPSTTPVELFAQAGEGVYLDVTGVNSTFAEFDSSEVVDGIELTLSAGGPIDVVLSQSELIDDQGASYSATGNYDIVRADASAGDVTIRHTHPGDLRVTGASVAGDMDLTASEGDLGLTNIQVQGRLRAAASGSIVDGGDAAIDVSATHAELEAGDSIGAGNALEIDVADAGNLAAVAVHTVDVVDVSGSLNVALAESATGDIHLNAAAGELYVSEVKALAGQATLTAHGSINTPAATPTAVVARKIQLLSASGAIGSVSQPLTIDTDSSLGVTGSAAAGIHVTETAGDLLADALASDTGDISLWTPDGSLFVDQVSAMGGSVQLTAKGSIGDATGDSAADVRGVSIRLAAGDLIGSAVETLELEMFGDSGSLSVEAGGGIHLASSAGGLQVALLDTSAGDIDVRVRDSIAPGENLILLPASRVSAPQGNVLFFAGDDFRSSPDTQVLAGGAIQVAADEPGADPGSGSNLEIQGDWRGVTFQITGGDDGDTLTLIEYTTDLPQITLSGGDGSDTLTVRPSSVARLEIIGGQPTQLTPGDVLNLDFTGVAGPIVVETLAGTAASASHQPVNWTGIEDPNVVGVPDLDHGDLLVLATDEAETIDFSAGSAENEVRVRRNYVELGIFQISGMVRAFGLGGNDTLRASSSLQFPVDLHGGEGHDRLYGTSLDDRLVGGGGNDSLFAYEGNNELWGDDLLVLSALPTDGSDALFAGDGNNTMHGGGGDDQLYAGRGDDVMFGGDGNDRLYAGDGNNRLDGGGGDDQLYAGSGDDVMFGGDGKDDLYASNGNNLLDGGSGDDHLYAGNGDQVMFGGDGNDQLFAGNGTNRLDGGGGDDVLYAGNGNDVMFGGDGNDLLYAGSGDNLLDGGSGNDQLYSGNGNDLLLGGEGNDYLSAGSGNDLMIGGTGRDELLGGSGDDLLIGGTTAYDDQLAALRLLMAEWLAPRSYSERVANLRSGTGPILSGQEVQLRSGGADATVWDDGAVDRLLGGSGRDGFFAALDDVSDRRDDELWELLAGE